MEKEEKAPLMALNHVSRVCRDVKRSKEFYEKVLGMVEMERPEALEHMEGAWLFNYGVGIHLVEVKEDSNKLPSASDSRVDELDPMDNHISFQCQDLKALEQRLIHSNIHYMKRTVGEDMEQLFFNDPDGFMVEICNCENHHLRPLHPSSLPDIRLPEGRHIPPLSP